MVFETMEECIMWIKKVDLNEENAKIIASFFVTIKEFIRLFNLKDRKKLLENLVDLDGIGSTQISSIERFFSNNTNIKITQNLINKLKISDFIVQSSGGKFSNKKLMFTGGFKNMSRSEAKLITENHGGKVLGTISKKLDFLVVGDNKPTKKKIDKAKELKIKILDENNWNKILDR